MWILGQPRHQRVVRWPIVGPLPLLLLFCTSDARISHLRLGRTIPTTLSSPMPHNGRALTSVNQRDGGDPKDNDSYQTTTSTHLAQRQACRPPQYPPIQRRSHTPSPRVDASKRRPTTVATAGPYHPRGTNGGHYPNKTQGDYSFIPTPHYKCPTYHGRP